MIHVVSGANQHLYARQLDQMFRLRPSSGSDGKEIDPEDEADDVIYLMCLDPWGEVAASVRLNRGAEGWRLSRWSGELRRSWMDSGGLPRNPHHELMLGVLEFSLAQGVGSLSLDMDAATAERFAAYGWAISHESGALEISPHLLAATRQTTGISQPMLIQLDPGTPPA